MRIIRTIVITGALISAFGGAAAAPAAKPFSDCRHCPSMMPLPPGEFVMGAASGEEAVEKVPKARAGHSEPQHRVVISYPFAIGKYDVTVDEFAAFVAETSYRTLIPCAALGQATMRYVGLDWRHPGFAETGNYPVTCVDWDDAKAYAAWLAKKTGRPYRLPSEAEWEYAARAGSATARYWGEGIDIACLYADVADAAAVKAMSAAREAERDFDCDDGYAHTAPVNAFKPNGFGLYGMLGNVWQWTEDCWNETYDGAPVDGSAWLKGNCDRRIFRSGAWSSHPRSIRSAYRIGDPHNQRTNDSGFRVALTLSP